MPNIHSFAGHASDFAAARALDRFALAVFEPGVPAPNEGHR